MAAGPDAPPAAWDGVVRLAEVALDALVERDGGRVVAPAVVRAIAPVETAGEGALAPLLSRRFLAAAREASRRGASILTDASLAGSLERAPRGLWVHEHPGWALASLLDRASVPDVPALVGEDCTIAASAVLGPRVVIGRGVRIGAGTVVGHPGFGWAQGPAGRVRAVPQLGGVVIEDDVVIGPLCTVDGGTLSPTRIRRGAKLDAHVHVGHNSDIGARTIVAAQCGFAGSVRVGADVLVGGQAGFADHVVVGDGARIAAKSGVIGDVPAGAVFAGYPAVGRMRWLRALARSYGASRGTR